MSRALALLRASHPEPGGAVTLAMALLALGAGHRGWRLVAVVLAVAFTQLAVGWVNDWLDADRDRWAGRRDKPVAAGAVSARTVGIFGLGAALAIPLPALALGAAPIVLICLVGVFALLYDWPLKSTPLSVVPYLVAFGLLPAFVVVSLPGNPAPPAWLIAAGALLGGGAHFANVLPDLADDAATGVRGLPHRIGARGSQVAAAMLLLGATLTLVFGPPGRPSWAGWAAAAASVVVLPLGVYASKRANGRPVALFRAVMVVALIDVVLLVLSGSSFW
ncbi:4-hydroxybenzoate polyprenyltransferase [Actinoplanes lutulentus]|uniref:4-hydroxybenzoate polyprenyltransferase n=1 Tax=Actinoplanes lutulentus TaxID=1287878 RepID=A0A327ZDN3_9ACTN|nr:UbiA family prenyltransferase [Actinoplanes lutulentus]MBB2945735.1 4-hydroxybenzoate polyprenyltransferase [Actinoplanes lutulentus]RAK37784.1 4-hydroxybenzoate polyprenyltransferase [Actinoplanes lutulentus]